MKFSLRKRNEICWSLYNLKNNVAFLLFDKYKFSYSFCRITSETHQFHAFLFGDSPYQDLPSNFLPHVSALIKRVRHYTVNGRILFTDHHPPSPYLDFRKCAMLINGSTTQVRLRQFVMGYESLCANTYRVTPRLFKVLAIYHSSKGTVPLNYLNYLIIFNYFILFNK